MPINPNIILGVQQPKFQMADPLESASRALQIQGLMGQQDLQGLQLDEARRGAESNERLRALFSGNPNATPEDVMRIDPTKGLKMRQDALNNRKTEGDINKGRAETLGKLLTFQKDGASAVMANPTAESAFAAVDQFERMATAFQMPELVQSAQRQRAAIQEAGNDPNVIRRLAAGWSMAAKDLLPQYKEINDGKTTRFVDTNAISNPGAGTQTVTMLTTPGQDQVDRRTREERAADRSVTMRGQNMTDSRSREANTISREANATTYDADRGVLVNRATGEARPAMQGGQPIGPRDKDLTDSQSKALLFGTRMQEAEKIFGDLSKKGVTTAIPGATAGYGVGAAINTVASPNQQSLVQAKRDFINAVLRRESGAVISPSEFDNAEKQYFPQVGDSPQVIAQKTANRKIAAEGIMQEVPQRRRPMQQGAVNPGAADPQIEALLKKYGG